MAEIRTLNKTERIEIVCIKKGAKSHYFKGKMKNQILSWLADEDIKLKQLINSLK